MAKGGSQTVTNKTELSPEQRKTLEMFNAHYFPDDKAPGARPDFNWDSNASAVADNYVSPFSTDQNTAFQMTRDQVGAQQPAMDLAKGMTVAGGAPTGTGITSQGMGWEGGNFDYDQAFDKAINPFMGAGLDQMNMNFSQQLNGINDKFAKSYGGSRQAVAQANALKGHDMNVGSYIQDAYGKAQTQANQFHDMGSRDIAQNNQNDQANATRLGVAGQQLGNLAEQDQKIIGNDINALAGVGAQVQGMDQTRRDAALGVQRDNETYAAQLLSAQNGFNPPSSTTQTSSKSGGSGAIWGQVGGSLLSMLPMLFSDERAKTKVKEADPGDSLKALRKLVPKTFEYNDDAKKHGAPEGRRAGFMAQNVEDVTGRPSGTMPGGYKGVDVGEHLGMLTHAIQAIDKKLAALDTRRSA